MDLNYYYDMKANSDSTLDERLTIFLTRKQKRLLLFLAQKETKETKRKVTVSQLVRRAVQEILEPSEQYVVCCNDFPDSVCSTDEVAKQVVTYRKIEYEKEKGTRKHWHVHKCSTFHRKPVPLKFCDFPPPDKASRDCPDAIMQGNEDWMWCEKQKQYRGHFLCTNKKHKRKSKNM